VGAAWMREASQATERFSLACHDGSRLRPRNTSPRLASLRLVRSSPHLPTSTTVTTPHLTPPRLVEPPSPTRATARPQWATRTASNLNRPGPAPGPSAPNSPRPPAPRRGSGKQASDRTLRLRRCTGCAATSAFPCATMSMPTYHRASESRSPHFPFGAVCSLGFWNPTGDLVCQLEPKGRYTQVASASGFPLFVALQVLNPASFGVSQAEGEGAPGGLACSVHGHGPLCTAQHDHAHRSPARH
jgi:hypothetical protein